MRRLLKEHPEIFARKKLVRRDEHRAFVALVSPLLALLCLPLGVSVPLLIIGIMTGYVFATRARDDAYRRYFLSEQTFVVLFDNAGRFAGYYAVDNVQDRVVRLRGISRDTLTAPLNWCFLIGPEDLEDFQRWHAQWCKKIPLPDEPGRGRLRDSWTEISR